MRQGVLLASLGVAAAAYSGTRPALAPQGALPTTATAVRAARVAPPPRCSAIFTPAIGLAVPIAPVAALLAHPRRYVPRLVLANLKLRRDQKRR